MGLTPFSIRWLSLFSLDAVLVALAWQEVLARVVTIHLTWQERALLGISVWIVYILDHLLDATVTTKLETINQAPRHHFVRKHRSFFISAVIVALLMDCALLLNIPFPLLLAGSVLGLITLFYLFLNTSLLARGRWLKGREMAIAIIFTLGCGLVPFVQTHQRAVLFLSMMALLLLNGINCVLIARLERGVAIKSLAAKLIPSPTWMIPGALGVLLINHLNSGPSIVVAFLWSLMGLSLIPIIAKKFGYEVASLATDGVLVAGALLSFVK